MLYVIAVVIAAAIVLLPAAAGARSLGSLIASAAGGIASLSAVSLLSVGGACLLQLNLFTLSISALLGIPGVIGLLMLRVIALT